MTNRMKLSELVYDVGYYCCIYNNTPDIPHDINHVIYADCSVTVAELCFVTQSGEHLQNSHQFLIVRHHHAHAAVRTRLLRLQYSKTVVMLVCTGTVTGLYYSSLDRQSQRKLRATADGVVRFLRYLLMLR